MNKNIKEFLIKNKKKIALIIIIFFGCIIRCLGIEKLPIGLNVDEASSAYEAYSIMKYGIDRNGNFLPVFLQAWGSGQNVLYTYIMIPFVKLFGVNLISTRLPMAIIGCISLIIWYKLLENIKNEKVAFIGVIFLAICPWHIMKSRWGLESNIFPDMVLWFTYLLIDFLQTSNAKKLYLASVILAFTAYSYGTAYMFLPIFCIILFIYLIYKKQVSIKQTIICFVIFCLIDWPILMYIIIINTFNLEQINLKFMTIPRLPINRYEEQTSLFSGNILKNVFINFNNSIKLLVFQNDGLAWNSIPKIGMYYITSSIFLIFGLVLSFKKNKMKNEFDNIVNIWFISSFLLLFVLSDANVNRINILIFPLIYYIVIGIYFVWYNFKMIVKVGICIIYILQFLIFGKLYISNNEESYWTFYSSLKDVIEYVDLLEDKKIYMGYNFKEPYIYVLYYTEYNTNDFVNTVKYFDEENLGKFDNIKSFGKYNFYYPDNFDEKNSVYVIKNEDVNKVELEKFQVKEFEKFIVLEEKN